MVSESPRGWWIFLIAVIVNQQQSILNCAWSVNRPKSPTPFSSISKTILAIHQGAHFIRLLKLVQPNL